MPLPTVLPAVLAASHDTLSNASNEDQHDHGFGAHAQGKAPSSNFSYGHQHTYSHSQAHAMAGEQPHPSGRSIGVRCIRCKKSKKGCDRQRPCGRCADADEECITEDESSGRKSRASGAAKKQKRP